MANSEDPDEIPNSADPDKMKKVNKQCLLDTPPAQ